MGGKGRGEIGGEAGEVTGVVVDAPTTICNHPWHLLQIISLHPSLSQPPGGTFHKLSSDAIFVVCSQTFSLLIDKDGRACQNILIQFPCVFFSNLFNFW